MKQYSVIAFDIDGTLTEDQEWNTYKQAHRDTDAAVGIITSRPSEFAEPFISELPMEPEFTKMQLQKMGAMFSIARQYPNGDKLYVGNTVRDSLATAWSGWDFTTIHSATEHF